MESEDGGDVDGSVTRRRVLDALGSGAVATMGATAGCVDSVSDGGNAKTTTAEGSVQFAHSAALSGTYVGLGEEEQLGFELAVRHLNDGGGLVGDGVFDALSGDGVLGRTVETITVDSGGSAEQTRSHLSPHLEDDRLTMFCGGVSGTVVREHRALAVEHEVPYMAGTSMIRSLTGENCSPHVYREQAPSGALIRALMETIGSELADASSYKQLYVDAPEGADFVGAVDAYFEGADGWEDYGAIPVRQGTTNMSQSITSINDSWPDVLFCHIFGLDAVNFLMQAAEELNDEIAIVVPRIDQSTSETLEGNVGGVFATVSWDPSLASVPSKAFADSYRTEAATVSGTPSHVPTGSAHHMYCQTLLFAAAAERAGSLDPADVRSELEGLTYDIGFGEQTLQACNHQASKPIPVVRGQTEKASNGGWFEVLTTQDGAVAGCKESPASNCSFSK